MSTGGKGSGFVPSDDDDDFLLQWPDPGESELPPVEESPVDGTIWSHADADADADADAITDEASSSGDGGAAAAALPTETDRGTSWARRRAATVRASTVGTEASDDAPRLGTPRLVLRLRRPDESR